jgi:ERCC4-related helicase
VTRDPRFDHLLNILSQARNDPQYLERRQPKIAKLKELLLEHFARHLRGGNSTRVLVFSQLRSTVQEMKAELAGVDGANCQYIAEYVFDIVCRHSST